MVNGRTAWLKVMEHSIMQMATFTKVPLSEIELMDTELTCMLTVRNMKETGGTTCSTAKAVKLQKMGANIKVSSFSERKTGVEHTVGLTIQFILVIGKIITQKAQENIVGLTVGSIKVSGRTTNCMEKEFTLGQTAGLMMETT